MSNTPATRNDLELLIHLLDQILRNGRDYCDRYRNFVKLGSTTRTFDPRESINKVIEASSNSIIRPSQDAAVLAKTVGPAIDFGIQDPGQFLIELGKSLRRLADMLAKDLSAVKGAREAVRSAGRAYLHEPGEGSPLEELADKALEEENRALDENYRALGRKIPHLSPGRHVRKSTGASHAPSLPLPTIDHVDSVESLLDAIEECALTLKSVPVAPSEQEREPKPDSLITVQWASKRWGHSVSWWKDKVGEGKLIPEQAKGNNREKLFFFRDAESLAKQYDLPMERRERSSI